jgi:hypothetical protein
MHEVPWKRFWCARTGTIDLFDGGFLFDLEGAYAEFRQRERYGLLTIFKRKETIL